MAVAGKQVGGRAVSYLSVRRGRPPAFYESGHGTTKRYTRDTTAAVPLRRVAIHAAAGASSTDGL